MREEDKMYGEGKKKSDIEINKKKIHKTRGEE